MLFAKASSSILVAVKLLKTSVFTLASVKKFLGISSAKSIVSLEEYSKAQSTWKSMPMVMIRKVAMVTALREAFPEDLQGMYDASEMQNVPDKLPEKEVKVGYATQGQKQTIMKLASILRNIAIIGCAGVIFCSGSANAVSRIKDIADFEGVRDNQLVGYGLIVGLNGTGDNIKSVDFAKESLISMLDMIGINARDGQIKAKNVAAVIVTANLPAFARQGSKIDVTV